MVSRPMKRPIAIDLFSGAGGLSLGLEQAGFDVVAAVEYDPVHAATHEFNFPECATICASVTELDGDTIRERSGIGSETIDLVAGGPPCQGFSLIGKRDLQDTRNDLVMDFQRLVVELRARSFLMENVPGMALGSQEDVLREVTDRFIRDGYQCLPYFLVTATSFGVPQRRKRLFLIGTRIGEELPDPNFEVTTTRSTVWDAIGDLPMIEEYPELLTRDWVKADFYDPSEYAAVLRRETTDVADFSHRRRVSSEILTASMRTVHSPKSVQRFDATRPGEIEPVSRYLRLDPSGFSNTLRAGTDGKHGAYTSPRPIHPFIPRVITVREGARLHSFPDWFRFHETKWHGFRQVGNAVAPRVGRAVASKLLGSLGYSPLRPTRMIKLGDPNLLSLSPREAAKYFGARPTVEATDQRLTA